VIPWHVSSSSGVATSFSELLYPCYFTYFTLLYFTDGQTDRQTDRITTPKTALSIARAVKTVKNFSSQPQNIYAQLLGNFSPIFCGFFSLICAQLAQISLQFYRIFSAILAKILRKFCIFPGDFLQGLHSDRGIGLCDTLTDNGLLLKVVWTQNYWL